MDVRHHGRLGDHALEVARLRLGFEESPGNPSQQTKFDALFDSVALYRDDGHGKFGIEDTPVQSFNGLMLSSGWTALNLEDEWPSASVSAGQQHRFFVVVMVAINARTLTPQQFRIARLARTGSTTKDRASEIPLRIERSPDFISHLYSVERPADLRSAPWSSAAGTAWPITASEWTDPTATSGNASACYRISAELAPPLSDPRHCSDGKRMDS